MTFRTFICTISILLVSVAAIRAQDARPADVGSLDAIMAATYDSISGGAGEKRDWVDSSPSFIRMLA